MNRSPLFYNYSDLTKDQTFVDDVRFVIRYGVCIVLKRAAKVSLSIDE